MDASTTTRIGRFIVDRKIGSGGMAHAYRCLLEGPSGFQKFVLVKILHTDHRESSHYYGMFLDEARLAARLQHPNIPQVFELGEHDGLPFMVMEYVAGPNLVMLHRKFRDGNPRHFGHLAFIFSRVARGLHSAHQLTDESGKPLNIVHRDVSLANILVGKDGHPKLIDFGIAKWEESETVTEVDVLKGKLRYMAPEQFQAKRPDPRVDIYQAGVAMYWLCTGRAPFKSGGLVDQLLARKVAPKKPSTHVYGFPEGLEAIILKCLERDPDDRYQTASDLADALEAFIASDPEFASGAQGVAAWIKELFPSNELEIYTSRSKTSTHEPSATRPLPGHSTDDLMMGTGTMSQMQQMPPQQQQPASSGTGSIPLGGWIGLVVVAIVSAVMTMQFNNQRRASDYAGFIAENPDMAAEEYLDKAQGLLDANDLAAARAVLLRVRRINGTSPDTEMRLSRLEGQVERLKTLTAARIALRTGDYDRALDKITTVLENHPDDEEAYKILTKIRAASGTSADGVGGDAEARAAAAERRARAAEARARAAEARADEADGDL